MTSNIKQIIVDSSSTMRGGDTKERLDRAVTDLVENSIFYVKKDDERNILKTKIVENKFIISLHDVDDEYVKDVLFPLSPLRRVIKDYIIICDSYFEAVKTADPRKIEAIDMGRRGVHNEGSEILEDLISDQINYDFDTLRKIFYLIFVLQIK